MKYNVILLSLLALATTACQTTGDRPAEETADATISKAELSAFKWALTELNGEPIEKGESGQVPYLIFRSEAGRIAGSGGCNRLMGAYELNDAGELRLGQIASTMMACDNLQQEIAFLQVLDQHHNWQLSGPSLQLSDDQGTRLALFEAAPLPEEN